MLTVKKKKPLADPIKRIGLNAEPLARDIVIQIANALGLKVKYDKDEEGNIIGVSAYGGDCLRLADHCTYLQTWVDAGTWKSPYRKDVVIEDEDTFAMEQVQEGYDFDVDEYVIKSQDMDVNKAKMIAYDIRNAINTGIYANNVGAERRHLVATHKLSTPENEESNNEINESKTNKNMKNTIKLNEEQLRQIVAESVKKVLGELCS